MEKQFLIDEFKLEESWRIFKIMGEFVEGVDIFKEMLKKELKTKKSMWKLKKINL